MTHELQTPLSVSEAAELARHYVFEQVECEGNILATFSSAAARDAAALEIRNRRMKTKTSTA